MGSGGSSSSRQQSHTAPWAAQQPFLEALYGYAQDLLGSGNYQYGPGRVAGMDDASVRGMGMAERRANAGSPEMAMAKQEFAKTIGGDYLSPDSNPWLSGMYDAASRGMTRNFQESVMPTLNTRFAMGRTQQDPSGNAQTAAMGRAQGELATGLGDMASNIYGGAYGAERGRMMQAGSMAPTFAQSDYMDSSMLRGIGAERQTFAQRHLDDIVARFNFNQFAPAQKLAEYAGFIGAPVMETESSGKSKSMNMSLLWG